MGILVGVAALLVLYGVPVVAAWVLRGQRDEARYQRDVAESLNKELSSQNQYLEGQLRIQEKLQEDLGKLAGGADSNRARGLLSDFNQSTFSTGSSSGQTSAT